MCEKVISETIKESCDLFKFGKILRNNNPKYFKSIENDWKTQILPSIKYNVKIESKISMFGMNDNWILGFFLCQGHFFNGIAKINRIYKNS